MSIFCFTSNDNLKSRLNAMFDLSVFGSLMKLKALNLISFCQG